MDTSNPTKDKKKAPVVDIEQELQATSFGKQRTQSITGIEPGKLLNLKIDQVVTYDRNPRREDNPEHEQIKSSIRHRGMDQVLSVTQRLNDSVDTFMIIHGGNTRLEILKELYEETNDPKFEMLQCRYVAWESESDALIGHLIENDARGDYSFIDRALGVRNAKEELERESGEQLSSRKLLSKLKEQGYKLSRPDLFRMNFAVDVLYPAMPVAMDSGIGPWQIDSIKKLQSHAKKLFEETRKQSSTDVEWGNSFHELLTKQNTENWSYDDLYSDVLLLLAEGDSTEANRLSFILSSSLEGLSKDEPTKQLEDKSSEPPITTETLSETSTQNGNPLQDDDNETLTSSNDREIDTPIAPLSSNEVAQQDVTPLEETPPNHELFPNTENSNQEATEALPSEITPKDLRSKLFTQALQLASNNGFGELIAPLPSKGAGFIIKDLLSESYMKGEKLFGTIKKRPYKERIMVWWMLFGFTELRMMALHKPEIIAPILPEGDLRNILVNQDTEEDQRRLALAHIFQRTGEFIIDDLSIYFWAVASEKNLFQIQEMQKLYRQLNEVLDFNLWEVEQ